MVFILRRTTAEEKNTAKSRNVAFCQVSTVLPYCLPLYIEFPDEFCRLEVGWLVRVPVIAVGCLIRYPKTESW
jgi:hypothetical protein